MQSPDDQRETPRRDSSSPPSRGRGSLYVGGPADPTSASAAGMPTGTRRARRTADPLDAARLLAATFGGGDLAVSQPDDAFSFRIAAFDTTHLSLQSIECSGEVSGRVPFFPRYGVTWFAAGSASITVNRAVRTSRETEPLMLPTERPFDLVMRPTRENMIHFAPEFVEDIATEFHGGDRRALSFDLQASAEPRQTDRWRSAVSGMTAVARSASPSPLVVAEAERALARALLSLFAWVAWPAPSEMRIPSAWRVRAALDHLHHHASGPVTPAEAARAAGIHTRTIQQATRRLLGTSPSAYLRDVRLERARLELAAADAATETVAAVAGRWGFGNLGRFASFYRIRYGEKPSETLRQRG